MVHETIAEKRPGCGMAFAKEFLREGHALVAALGSSELEKLAGGEVPGMCGHEVEKASLVLGVAEAAKVGETGFRKVHRLKMTVFNSHVALGVLEVVDFRSVKTSRHGMAPWTATIREKGRARS